MPVKVPNETSPLAEVLFVELEDVVVPIEFPVLDLSRENAMWGKHHHGCTTLTPAMHGKQRLIAAAKVITGNGNRGNHLGFCCSRSKCERVAIFRQRGFYFSFDNHRKSHSLLLPNCPPIRSYLSYLI